MSDDFKKILEPSARFRLSMTAWPAAITDFHDFGGETVRSD